MDWISVIVFVAGALGATGASSWLGRGARVIDRVVSLAAALLPGVGQGEAMPDELVRRAIERAAAAAGVKLDAREVTRAIGKVALAYELARLDVAAKGVLDRQAERERAARQ